MGQGLQFKRKVVKGLSERLSSARSVVMVDFSGVSVEEITELRSKARDKDVGYFVSKNNLIRRALEGTPFACLESDLVGPTAFGVGYDDSLAVVKLISECAKEIGNLRIKAGYVDGSYATAAEIEQIAKLPGREELIAMLLGVLQMPMARLVSTLNGPITKFVRTLSAIVDSREEEQSEVSDEGGNS